jgi:Gpi18-like mannosyltransferase
VLATDERRTLPLGLDRLNNDEDRRNLKRLFALFVGLAVAVYIAGYVAWKTLGLASGTPESLVHSVFDRWDVLNYVIISQDGYGPTNHYAVWFPGMPMLMWTGSQFGIAEWLTGTIVVLACAAVLTAAFYALARLDFDTATARDATLFLLVFPSSFFLFIPYTEAILLALAVCSLYLARQGKWAPACLLAAVASLVRLPGAFLAPALVVEYLHQRNWQWRAIRADVVWIAIAPAGAVAYMLYLWAKFDDIMAYSHAQRDFFRLETIPTRGGFHFIPSLIDEVRVIFETPSLSEGVQNAAGLLGLMVFVPLFLLMLWYRMRPSYIVYSALAGFSSLTLGRLESVNRYIIAAFPMFLVIGLLVQMEPRARWPLVTLCLVLFFASAVRFSTYNWAG